MENTKGQTRKQTSKRTNEQNISKAFFFGRFSVGQRGSSHRFYHARLVSAVAFPRFSRCCSTYELTYERGEAAAQTMEHNFWGGPCILPLVLFACCSQADDILLQIPPKPGVFMEIWTRLQKLSAFFAKQIKSEKRRDRVSHVSRNLKKVASTALLIELTADVIEMVIAKRCLPSVAVILFCPAAPSPVAARNSCSIFHTRHRFPLCSRTCVGVDRLRWSLCVTTIPRQYHTAPHPDPHTA